MLKKQSLVAAIHDLSGFGPCSLSVILPCLSAMGVQVCAVPTAVLSSHTGGLGEVEFRDLTDYIRPALEHYKRLDLPFDCIYSGFLGSEEQICHCLEFFAAFPNAFKVVDPVMGDHGKAYKTCNEKLRAQMKELVSHADLITPNMTEASMLLGESYPTGPVTQGMIKSWLLRLCKLGPKFVLITGVEMADGEIANVGYDSERSAFWRVDCDYVPASYPGTGDIYASVIVGSLLTGDSLPIAMERATRFLELAIKTTFSYGTDTRYGVMLERNLAWLTQLHSLKGYHLM